MKHLSRKIGMIVIAVSIALGMTGCSSGSDVDHTETFSPEQINKISITTEGNNVIARSTKSKQIAVSLKGFTGQLASLKSGSLNINVPSTGPGIHLKAPNPLYIDIPEDGCPLVSIESESGNVRMDHVNIAELNVKLDGGNIETIGMQGSIDAKSEVGNIETSLPVSSKVTVGDGDVGYQLEGLLGNGEGKSKKLLLYTNTGNIHLD